SLGVPGIVIFCIWFTSKKSCFLPGLKDATPSLISCRINLFSSLSLLYFFIGNPGLRGLLPLMIIWHYHDHHLMGDLLYLANCHQGQDGMMVGGCIECA